MQHHRSGSPQQQALSFGCFFPFSSFPETQVSDQQAMCACRCVHTHHILRFLLVNVSEGQGERAVPLAPSPLGVLHHPVQFTG